MISKINKKLILMNQDPRTFLDGWPFARKYTCVDSVSTGHCLVWQQQLAAVNTSFHFQMVITADRQNPLRWNDDIISTKFW